jgi:lactoylglutathione lyase
MVKIQKIHHVAYRCKDAKETVEWYGKYLNMDFVLAIAENQVPSTKEPDPYMHIFLDAGGGNILAFFELPTKEPMGRDPNTPAWVQHLAMQVDSVDDLLETKARLEADGIDVVGPTSHHLQIDLLFRSQRASSRACRQHRHRGDEHPTRRGQVGHAQRMGRDPQGARARALDA